MFMFFVSIIHIYINTKKREFTIYLKKMKRAFEYARSAYE
jgi:hypothetical protein